MADRDARKDQWFESLCHRCQGKLWTDFAGKILRVPTKIPSFHAAHGAAALKRFVTGRMLEGMTKTAALDAARRIWHMFGGPNSASWTQSRAPSVTRRHAERVLASATAEDPNELLHEWHWSDLAEVSESGIRWIHSLADEEFESWLAATLASRSRQAYVPARLIVDGGRRIEEVFRFDGGTISRKVGLPFRVSPEGPIEALKSTT